MKIRIVGIILCFTMIISLLMGCGSTQSSNSSTQEATVENSADTGKTVSESDSKSNNSSSNVKKKIVIIQEGNDDVRITAQKGIKTALESGGYKNGENAEIIDVMMESNDKAGPETIQKVKDLKPDLVIMNVLVYYLPVAQALNDAGIAVIMDAGIDTFVDENGHPKGHITGVYSMPKELTKNTFDLLNKIAPINGKKAVFITQEGAFTKEGITDSLKKLNIELKAYVNYKYAEEFEQIVKQYNSDPEVGWVLIGVWAMLKKDGTSLTLDAVPGADYLTKPGCTFWEVGIGEGMLCGLGVDLPSSAAQTGELAVKYLKGEDIKNITAVQPSKTNILINKKRADALKLTIPADLLGSAYKVYTDYDSHIGK